MSVPSELVRAGPLATRYVRVLGAFLLLQALSGAAVKLFQGRGDDLPHAGVHLLSGVVALWASSPRRRASATRCFAVGFGLLYLTLGVLGQLEARAVAGLNLEVADHVFHVVVGAVTFSAGASRTGSRPSDVLTRSP